MKGYGGGGKGDDDDEYLPLRSPSPSSGSNNGQSVERERKPYGSVARSGNTRSEENMARKKPPPPLPPHHHSFRHQASNVSFHHVPWYRDHQEVARGILYGTINAMMCVPVSISFATIIFRNEAFYPYLPALVRLVLFSSMVHALCFGCLSSLPFAVGQVQDAGLIFLSSMASTIAEDCKEKGYSDDIMLGTVLAILSLSTATLGLALVLVGKLKLASVRTLCDCSMLYPLYYP